MNKFEQPEEHKGKHDQPDDKGKHEHQSKHELDKAKHEIDEKTKHDTTVDDAKHKHDTLDEPKHKASGVLDPKLDPKLNPVAPENAPQTVAEGRDLESTFDPLDNNLPNRIAPQEIFPAVPVTAPLSASVGGPLVLSANFHELMTIGDWLKGELESPKDYCRESVTITTAAFLPTGSVLGKITASGKYAPLDPAAADGSNAVAAILIYDLAAKAVAADSKVAILARGPAFVYASKLSFLPNVTGPQKTTALAQMEALGIQAVLEA